jgi:methylmalonyl-CoA decarboxylase
VRYPDRVSIPDPPPVDLAVDGFIATLTMQDPAKRNALGRAMLDGLIDAFRSLEARDVRAVVLRARPGDRVWCAGFDIGELAPDFDPLAQDGPLQALFRCVAECRAPVIAMLHGSAWGGGTDLALRCDIAVADPTCSLAFTPARLGLPYDPDGLLNVLLRAGMHVAMEMFSTADPVPADRALALRLVNHVVPEAELEAFTFALAVRITANAPLSVASAKQQLRALAQAMPLAPAIAQRLHEGRRLALGSEDYRDGLAAFHARRAAVFRGR